MPDDQSVYRKISSFQKKTFINIQRDVDHARVVLCYETVWNKAVMGKQGSGRSRWSEAKKVNAKSLC